MKGMTVFLLFTILLMSQGVSFPAVNHPEPVEAVAANSLDIESIQRATDSQNGEGQADFSKSEMVGSAKMVREGDTIEYTLIVRNTGNRNPGWLGVKNPVPSSAMLVSFSPDLTYDENQRELQWSGQVAPGAEHRLKIRLVTIPESAGSFVDNWATIYAETGGSTVSFQTEVRVKLRPSKFILPGGIGIGWAEVIILGYLVFVPLFMLTVPRLIRSREKQRYETSPHPRKDDDSSKGNMLYVMSCFFVLLLAFMFFLGFIVLEDIRMFVSYEKTTGTILDKNIKATSSSTFSYPSPSKSSQRRNYYYDPMVAVRYLAGGEEVIAAGSIARGSLLSSREKSALKKLARYKLGESYPCWYDPEDPQKVVFSRSLSWGWYLLGIFPMLVFVISAKYLVGRFLGRKASSKGLPPAPIRRI